MKKTAVPAATAVAAVAAATTEPDTTPYSSKLTSMTLPQAEAIMSTMAALVSSAIMLGAGDTENDDSFIGYATILHAMVYSLTPIGEDPKKLGAMIEEFAAGGADSMATFHAIAKAYRDAVAYTSQPAEPRVLVLSQGSKAKN